MRVSQVLSAALLCASSASGYWIRGAAERALYYSVYVLEDIHFNKEAYDGWKIAPDCVGTRKGMWQKKRCNLAEFIDHIWKETNPGEPRPDKTKIQWGNEMKGAKDPQSIISMIMSAKYKDGSMVIQRDTDPKRYGYTGKIEVADKVWPGQGITDYYASLSRFGERAVKLQGDFNTAIDKGEIVTDPENSKYKQHKLVIEKFQAFFQGATDAAEMIVEFRTQDKWRHLKDQGKWKQKLGVDGVWDPKTSNHNIGAWEEINKSDTIQQMVDELDIDKAEATKRYEEHWTTLTTSEQSKQHAAAIESAKKTFNALQEAPSCKG
ncbi:hypothetical protein ACO1O0_003796 [Amphichorda felina]